jgi:hypothetical protein
LLLTAYDDKAMRENCHVTSDFNFLSTREGCTYASYFSLSTAYEDIMSAALYGFDRCELKGQPYYAGRVEELREYIFRTIIDIKD